MSNIARNAPHNFPDTEMTYSDCFAQTTVQSMVALRVKTQHTQYTENNNSENTTFPKHSQQVCPTLYIM